MHPWHAPRCRVVRGVRHVHAARAAENDGPRARRLGHQLHDLRRLAALTRAVTRSVVFLMRNLLDSLEGFQLLGRFLFHKSAHLIVILSGSQERLTRYPRSPIHSVKGCDLPLAASNVMLVICSTS